MTIETLSTLAQRPELLIIGLILTVLVLAWVARKVRKLARSERPDDALSNVAMLIGFGWSSEAVWELTSRIGFGLELQIPLFAFLEVVLAIAMIRAKRNIRELLHPGRAGRTAWLVASSMALVAGLSSASVPEAVLRIVIPLLVVRTWWDSLVPEGAETPAGTTSWNWTPRNFLLWLGAIKPGVRDLETVNREQLTQQMTRLEHRRRHGWWRLAGRRAARLARLSLTADDEVIAEVQRRVGRARWFEVKQPEDPQDRVAAGVPARMAASGKVRRVLHRRSLRTVRIAHPRPVIVAGPAPDVDPRSKQEIDQAIRLIKDANGALTQRQIAHLLRTSDTKVYRALRSSRVDAPDDGLKQINGREPTFAAAAVTGKGQ